MGEKNEFLDFLTAFLSVVSICSTIGSFVCLEYGNLMFFKMLVVFTFFTGSLTGRGMIDYISTRGVILMFSGAFYGIIRGVFGNIHQMLFWIILSIVSELPLLIVSGISLFENISRITKNKKTQTRVTAESAQKGGAIPCHMNDEKTQNTNDSYFQNSEPVFGVWRKTHLIDKSAFISIYEIEREDFGAVHKSALKVITIPSEREESERLAECGIDSAKSGEHIVKKLLQSIIQFTVLSNQKNNSNIVRYEDHQVIHHENNGSWDILIKMELLTPMITHLKKANHITSRDVAKIGIDICRALEILHSNNIIHHNISPDSIFISDNGIYKLGGLSIKREIETMQTELVRKGAPSVYEAPEAYRSQQYDARIDIYSLGIVLYKLLNNNRAPFMPPFHRKISFSDKEKAIGMLLSGQPLPPPTNSDNEKLSQIIIKACSYLPENRYSTPSEMREALEEYLNNCGFNKYYPKLINTRTLEVIHIKKGIFKIGRNDNSNDYNISDNKNISHTHCHIVMNNGEYFIIDDNSRNHTYVNYRLVPPGYEFPISNDCLIKMANETFVFIFSQNDHLLCSEDIVLENDFFSGSTTDGKQFGGCKKICYIASERNVRVEDISYLGGSKKRENIYSIDVPENITSVSELRVYLEFNKCILKKYRPLPDHPSATYEEHISAMQDVKGKNTTSSTSLKSTDDVKNNKTAVAIMEHTVKKFPGLFDRCFKFCENKTACPPFEDGYYVLEYDVIFKVDTFSIYILTEGGFERSQHLISLWYGELTMFTIIPNDIVDELSLSMYSIILPN